MANKERGALTLRAGTFGELTLLLTTNACCDMEDRANKPFDDVIDGLNKGNVRDIRWLLWACLQEHHAATVKTPADAGRVIDEAGGIAGVARQLTRFMTLNTADAPTADPPEGGSTSTGPPSAEAPTGVDSTLTPVASA